MSIDVMTQVWKYSRAYGSDLLIMLAIADHADDYGKAYPSVNTLAHKGRMSERNVQYCLRHLESLGELKVLKSAGPHGTHLFQISIEGANFAPVKTLHPNKKSRRNKDLTSEWGANIAGVQTFRGERAFAGGVQPVAPESSVEPSVKETTKETPPENANAFSSPTPRGDGESSEPPKKVRQPRKPKHLPSYDPDGYQAFIAAFPRHTALPEAVKAWDWLQPDATLQADILTDIEQRRAHDQKWADGFITHPATYLRGERWRDDIIPSKCPRASPSSRVSRSEPSAGEQSWLERREVRRSTGGSP